MNGSREQSPDHLHLSSFLDQFGGYTAQAGNIFGALRENS
jgi:hypothetical protein